MREFGLAPGSVVCEGWVQFFQTCRLRRDIERHREGDGERDVTKA